jgi:hypothetical protein
MKTIEDFLKLHKNSKLTVRIQAGESAIPNTDNERPGHPSVDSGYLSGKRGDSLVATLTTVFNKFIADKLISEIPTFTKDKPIIGTAKVKGAQASNEQFVRAIIDAESTEIVDEKCLINLQFFINYEKTWGVIGGVDRSHSCDRAQYALYANDVPIMNVDRRDYIVNLNNADTGQSMHNRMVVSKEDAKKIVQGHDDIKIKIFCMSDGSNLRPNSGGPGCHSDALNIRIVNGDGVELLAPSFITTGRELGFKEGRAIMLLDKCGKPLNTQLAGSGGDISAKENPNVPNYRYNWAGKGSNEPPKELVPVYKKNMFGKETGELTEYTDASLAEIFKYVDTDGIIRYTRSATDMKPLRGFNGKPWTIIQGTYFGSYGTQPKSWSDDEKKEIEKKQKKVYDYLVAHPELTEKVKKEREADRTADKDWYSQYGLEKEVK